MSRLGAIRNQSALSPMRLFYSIRGALTLVGLVAVAPALAIIVYTGIEHGAMLEQDVRDDARRQGEAFAQIQQRITTSVEQTLATIALTQEFQSSAQHAQEQLMQRVLQQNPEYVNMAYTDASGYVQASPHLPLGTDLSHRRHMQEALRSGGFAVGEYVISRAGEEASIGFAHAVVALDGRVLGALGVVYRLSSYRQLFDTLALPAESSLSLLDHRGIILFAHPPGIREPGETAFEIEQELRLPLHARAVSAGTAAVPGPDGVRRYYAARSLYLPNSETPYMTVLLGIPEDRAREPMIATLRRNIVLMGLVTVAALGLSQVFGNAAFGKRLRALNKVAGEISAGRLAQELELPSDRSEIGRLGLQMQEMARSLELRSRERDSTELSLKQTIEEKDSLLREVHHRVKNNLQLILSLVRLQGCRDPEASNGRASIENFCKSLEGRLAAMAEVHELLYAETGFAVVELGSFIQRLGSVVRSIHGQRSPVYHLSPVSISLEQAVPVALVLNEFMANAYLHGDEDMTVSLSLQDHTATLSVQDHGPGLAPGFDPARHGGLGFTLAHTLAGQLGGEVFWSSPPGPEHGTAAPLKRGTVATLRFPWS